MGSPMPHLGKGRNITHAVFRTIEGLGRFRVKGNSSTTTRSYYLDYPSLRLP